MLAYIQGILALKTTEYVVLDVGGLGYKIHVPLSTLDKLPAEDRKVLLHTYMHVREDGITLYGFYKEEGLRLFEFLLSVSGIGPKVAINVLSNIDHAPFYTAILTEDIKQLTRIPGIGKKTAQRLILELKEKVGRMQPPTIEHYEDTYWTDSTVLTEDQEAVNALEVLGYTRSEAVTAISRAKQALETPYDVAALIKKALQHLSKM